MCPIPPGRKQPRLLGVMTVAAPLARRRPAWCGILPDESKLCEICAGFYLSNAVVDAVALAATVFADGVVTARIASIATHGSADARRINGLIIDIVSLAFGT